MVNPVRAILPRAVRRRTVVSWTRVSIEPPKPSSTLDDGINRQPADQTVESCRAPRPKLRRVQHHTEGDVPADA